MEIEKQKSKGILVVIIILSLVIVGLVGFICYEQFVVKKESNKPEVEKTNNNEEIKAEELSIYNETVKKLYSPFTHYTYEATSEEIYKKDTITTSDLSDTYKNRMAFAYYFDTFAKGNRNNAYDGKVNSEQSYLLSSTFEKYYKELFGKNASYNPMTFSSYGIDTLAMNYDKSNSRYTNIPEMGDASFYRYATQLYKAIQTNNTIELYEYVIIVRQKMDSETIYIFNNLTDAKNYKNPIAEYTRESWSQLINDSNEVDILSSKLSNLTSKYKITYKKDNSGNYYFDKVEKVIENNTNNIQHDNYAAIGVWQYFDSKGATIPYEEIIVNKVDGSKVHFDFIINKTTNFEGIVGTFKDDVKENVATFDVKNENDWIIKGTLVFRENNVILNIEYSSSDLIKTGSITFEKASKSILQ